MNKLIKLQELAKDIRLLYVEDEESLRDIMKTYLGKFFAYIDTAENGQVGLEYYEKNQYDLVITDILMPKLDGIEMASKIKEINPKQNIVIISAYADTNDFIQSIKIGIDGYILKPIDFEQLNAMLFKIVDKIHQFEQNIQYQNNLEVLVDKKTEDIKALEEAKVNNYKETIYALVQMIEQRDTYTGGHSLRVAQYSKKIAHILGFEESRCENIYQAGILHDIGKVAIPDNVLLKPSKLDELEYTIIQEHVKLGVDMLRKVPLFDELTKFIEEHHERYNGTGYPYGLKGDEISIESQILAVSDAFDAMTTNRIYKARKTPVEAVKELVNLINIHFREDVVNAASIALKDVVIDASISQLPITNIEKARFSYFYKDQITEAYNSQYLDFLLIKNSYEIEYRYLNIISIHNLNLYNKKYGWKNGDKYLATVVEGLETVYKDLNIFRVFSDDFVILSKEELHFNKQNLEQLLCIDEIILEIEIFNIEEQEIYSFHDLELIR
ncbi:MAG: HD domain-containing phosphohydrolase [Arcobacteraceae bacterium]